MTPRIPAKRSSAPIRLEVVPVGSTPKQITTSLIIRASLHLQLAVSAMLPWGAFSDFGEYHLDGGFYKYFTFAHDERVPKLRINMTAVSITGHEPRESYGLAPFIINGGVASGLAAANDIAQDAAGADWGLARQIYIQMRLEW